MIIAMRWFGRGQPDLLQAAPVRRNVLREDAMALTILVYLLSLVVLAGLVKWLVGDTESVRARLLLNTTTQFIGIGLCVFVGATHFEGGIRRFLHQPGGWMRGRGVLLAGMVTVLALGLCPLILGATREFVLMLWPSYTFEAHPTISALHDPSQPLAVGVAIWAGAVVLAPVMEELFFRGLVQTYLGEVLRGRWRAVLGSAAAFGLVHSFQPQATVALAFLGVLLGFVYERTGSLVWPILIHAAFNLKTLIWDAVGG